MCQAGNFDFALETMRRILIGGYMLRSVCRKDLSGYGMEAGQRKMHSGGRKTIKA